MYTLSNNKLRDYYRIGYDSDTMYKYRERMEKYHDRIDKYILKYKTKELVFEHGCYNMNVLMADLTGNYELVLYLGDNKHVIIDLRSMIENDIQMRYDRKYHTIYFPNMY